MALRKDFSIDAGATFLYAMIWRQPQVDTNGNVVYAPDPLSGQPVPVPGDPVNLTGFVGKMQSRRNLNDAEALITLNEVMITDPALIDFSVSAIYIVPLLGYIAPMISKADTTSLVSGVYDLGLMSPNGFEYRLLGGKTRVNAAVTRD